MNGIKIPNRLKGIHISQVREGEVVCVHGHPGEEREGEDWAFIGLACPKEGGVRFGPDNTLYETQYVLVPSLTGPTMVKKLGVAQDGRVYVSSRLDGDPSTDDIRETRAQDPEVTVASWLAKGYNVLTLSKEDPVFQTRSEDWSGWDGTGPGLVQVVAEATY